MKDDLKFIKENSYKFFNDISRTYVCTNHLMSTFLDIYWRKKTAEEVLTFFGEKEQIEHLDLACGGGEFIEHIHKQENCKINSVGLDMSVEMLERGKRKFNNSKNIQFIKGDCCKLPFENNSFDLLTIAFGLRNLYSLNESLSEARRVLKNNGIMCVLDFSPEQKKFFKYFYLFYLRYIVPVIGGLISGNFKAYKYLNKSIEDFPASNKLLDIFNETGFTNLKYKNLTFGTVNFYIIKKNE